MWHGRPAHVLYLLPRLEPDYAYVANPAKTRSPSPPHLRPPLPPPSRHLPLPRLFHHLHPPRHRHPAHVPPAPAPGRGARRTLPHHKSSLAAKPPPPPPPHGDRGAARQEQLRAVPELCLSLAEPAIVLGDFNPESADPLLPLRHTPGV